jgi:hypothetical protein
LSEHLAREGGLMSSAIDAFIESKVKPELRPVVAAFRRLVKRVAPEASEGMRGGTEAYYGVPVYRVKRDIIAISPTKTSITISFGKGAQFNDQFGRLGGTGKASRVVRLRSMEDFDEVALTSYVRQAVDLDLAI